MATTQMNELPVVPVVTSYEQNGYSDSDWYDVVWLGPEGGTKHVLVDTTRGGMTRPHRARPLTPEEQEEYDAWAHARAEAARAKAEAAKASIPDRGMMVEVIKGKHKGLRGEVRWRGHNQFRAYYRSGYNQPDQLCNQRVGVSPSGGGDVVFTALLNCIVVGAPMSPEEADAYVRVSRF